MNRIAGMLMIGFSLLATAVVFMLAQVSSKADEIDGNYGGGWFGQIPPVIFLLLIAAVFIGITIMNRKDK